MKKRLLELSNKPIVIASAVAFVLAAGAITFAVLYPIEFAIRFVII